MIQHYDILAGCRRRDPRAQRLFYDLFKNKLMGICRRYAGSREEAQDVLQEAFIKIFTRIDQLTEIDKLESWIKSIVIRTAIDGYHKQKAREVVIGRMTNESMNVEEATGLVLQGLTSEALMQVVNGLPAGCRIVFNLHAVEGYSHVEIAAMLQISEGTSRSQYHHAKSLLKEKLRSKSIAEYYGKLA